MVKFSLNFLDFSRDLDNSDFFQYNFWVSFDGPSTYYIISRERTGVGGSAKYKKLTKSEKGFILVDPTVIFKVIPTDPYYQQKFSNT